MRNYMIRLLCFFAAVICLPPAMGAAAVPADFSTDIGGEPQENCGEEGPKLVAITFDDGPNPITTEQLLDGLAARGAKATFFILGQSIDESICSEKVPKNRALVKRMIKEGHVVGNHSYSHPLLSKCSKEKVREELTRTSELIKELTGAYPIYMRPPGGAAATAPWVREIANPMITVCWGYFDTKDWKYKNKERIVKIIVDHVIDGDIILLHDNYVTSVEAALEAIDILQARGFQFVTVDTLLKRNMTEGMALDPRLIYYIMPPGDTSKLVKAEDLP